MPELGPYGSMRGARGNLRPYRDHGPRFILFSTSPTKECSIDFLIDPVAFRGVPVVPGGLRVIF
jgi:hypothetical protein